jgi:hypothetical protein
MASHDAAAAASAEAGRWLSPGRSWVDVMTAGPCLPAVEIIYRQLATPKPEDAKPASVAAAKPLTRDDATAIVARKRSATAEELQDIIARARSEAD